MMTAFVAATGCAAGVLQAQVLPPVPPPAPPAPTYTPPPKPPTPPPPAAQAPVQPPTPAEPPISLVERDAEGRLIPIEGNREEAALRKLALDEDKRAIADRAIAEHYAETDRRVIQNMATAVTIMNTRERIDRLGVAELQQLPEAIGPLRQQSVLDRAQTMGAVTPRQRRMAGQAVDEYQRAESNQLTQEVGENIAVLIPASLRRLYMSATGDVARSVERQLARVEKLDVLPLLGLSQQELERVRLTADASRILQAARPTEEQRATIRSMLEGLPAADRGKALRRVVLEILEPEQAGAMLRAAQPELYAAEDTE